MNFHNRTVLITGGSRGIGKAIALKLAAEGANIAIAAKTVDPHPKLEGTIYTAAAEIEKAGTGKVLPLQADIRNEKDIEVAVKKTVDTFGGIDILINNAGRTWAAPVESFPDKGWTSVLAINVQMPFRLAQEFLPDLEASGRRAPPARILNIGSIAGKVIEPLQAYSYGASKAGLHHLSRQLAADLAERSITVNTICPGYFPTSMTAHLQGEEGTPSGMLEGHIPLKRFGSPADIAGAVVFLCSRAGAYVTGTELVVDGGITGCR